jgi:hypothetical protein
LPGSEFDSISSASYSADGKYLAVLEQTNQLSRNLQIIDMTSGKSFLPSDVGFGTDTPSYVWDENRPVVYAITGEGEDLKFASYDLTNPDQPVVKAVDGVTAYDSPLAIAGGQLYFIRWSDDLNQGQLCAMAPTGGIVRSLGEGSAFILSPDKKYAALRGEDQDGGTSSAGFLHIVELSTGRVMTLESERSVVDMVWDLAGDRLYYSVYDADAEDQNLPLELCSYDLASGQVKSVMHMIMGALYPARDTRQALLVYIFHQTKQDIPMTYELDIAQ